MPVGYDPRRRSLSLTFYVLDHVNGPVTTHTADLSADPWSAGMPGSSLFILAYERRYGPHTMTGGRFKRWAKGPNSEVKSTIRDALTYLATSQHAAAFGLTPSGDGVASEREVTDVLAFGDAPVWQTYLRDRIPGYRRDNRITVNDPARPSGDGEEKHFFWKMTYYFHNTYKADTPIDPPPPPPPPPPPIDPPPSPTPTPTLSSPEQRAEELWSLTGPVRAWTYKWVPGSLKSIPELWPALKPLVVELIRAWRRR